MLKKIILFTIIIILSSFTKSYCKDLEYRQNFEESYKYLQQSYINELPLYEKVLLPFLKDINAIDIELNDMKSDMIKIITSRSYEKLTPSEVYIYDSLNNEIDLYSNILGELRFRTIIIYMIKDTYRNQYYEFMLQSIQSIKRINAHQGPYVMRTNIIKTKPLPLVKTKIWVV